MVTTPPKLLELSFASAMDFTGIDDEETQTEADIADEPTRALSVAGCCGALRLKTVIEVDPVPGELVRVVTPRFLD